MTDIVARLRATLLDRDNFPRMDSEKWLPVGLAKEAADEIEWLRKELDFINTELDKVRRIMDGPP
jgi:hypothetical protein